MLELAAKKAIMKTLTSNISDLYYILELSEENLSKNLDLRALHF